MNPLLINIKRTLRMVKDLDKALNLLLFTFFNDKFVFFFTRSKPVFSKYTRLKGALLTLSFIWKINPAEKSWSINKKIKMLEIK